MTLQWKSPTSDMRSVNKLLCMAGDNSGKLKRFFVRYRRIRPRVGMSQRPRHVEGFSSLHPIMRMRAWVDRRLGRRTTVNNPAVVHQDESEFNATIKNISTTGLGLKLAEPLPIGRIVEVSVGDFSVLGFVRWSEDGSAGVELMSKN